MECVFSFSLSCALFSARDLYVPPNHLSSPSPAVSDSILSVLSSMFTFTFPLPVFLPPVEKKRMEGRRGDTGDRFVFGRCLSPWCVTSSLSSRYLPSPSAPLPISSILGFFFFWRSDYLISVWWTNFSFLSSPAMVFHAVNHSPNQNVTTKAFFLVNGIFTHCWAADKQI